MTSAPHISVIVPVYKEEHSITPFLKRLEPVLEKIGAYEILFCMDPSPDGTAAVIEAHIERNPRISLLVMSRRFGQPAAVIAGVHHAKGDYAVVIDVDLQDPPEVIEELYRTAVKESFDVVYATRRSREGETWVKRLISWLGYGLIARISDVKIPPHTGDFRIMSRRVIEQLAKLKETHGFLRGLVAYVGFKQGVVKYDRAPRAHGAGNYNRYWGSIKIGFNGVVGFSNALLSATLLSGIVIAGISFLIALWMVYSKFILGTQYPTGIPTVTILILFMGGVQLISIGILGEYIGRIYDEVRQRPAYILDKIVGEK